MADREPNILPGETVLFCEHTWVGGKMLRQTHVFEMIGGDVTTTLPDGRQWSVEWCACCPACYVAADADPARVEYKVLHVWRPEDRFRPLAEIDRD